MEDVIETAKILSALKVNGVKLHSLYVVKGTKLAQMYEKGEVSIGSLNDYVERAVTFLEHLNPSIVIHRLASDPPREGTLFGNWGLTKNEIVKLIEKRLEEKNTWQGKQFDYLNV